MEPDGFEKAWHLVFKLAFGWGYVWLVGKVFFWLGWW